MFRQPYNWQKSLYSPEQALSAPASLSISQPAHEIGKFVSPTHRPPLHLVLINVSICVDPSIILPEGLSQWPHRESNPRPSGL